MSIGEGCFCAVTKTGAKAGCACLSIITTELGPRVIEGPGEPRGDGAYLEAVHARHDAETRAAFRDGAPAGSFTKDSWDAHGRRKF